MHSSQPEPSLESFTTTSTETARKIQASPIYPTSPLPSLTLAAELRKLRPIEDGNFSVNVAPGLVTIAIDPTDPNLPPNYIQTEGTITTTITVTAGVDTPAGNNGFASGQPSTSPSAAPTLSPASVSGHLFLDINGNGVQDNPSTEPDIVNVTVIVTDSQGNIQSVPTDENGMWTANVEPGLVTIYVNETDPNLPPIVIQTLGDNPTTVTAVAGQNVKTDDAFQPAGTVTGKLYYDVDGDGTQDPGEPNLSNVSITISRL